MVVPGDRQHAAVAGGAEGVGVLDHVHAAVDTGALAVPHAKDTVVFGAAEELGLLAAPDRGRSQVFIEPGLKMYLVLRQPGFGLPQGLIDPTQRRAAIAGDKPGGVESGALIALVLQHRQAHQCLDTRHIGTGRIQGVLVVQGHLADGLAVICTHHCSSSREQNCPVKV